MTHPVIARYRTLVTIGIVLTLVAPIAGAVWPRSYAAIGTFAAGALAFGLARVTVLYRFRHATPEGLTFEDLRRRRTRLAICGTLWLVVMFLVTLITWAAALHHTRPAPQPTPQTSGG